jgi:hypothetical protein
MTTTSENTATTGRLQSYLNARVSVYYENSYTDTGAITYIDNAWVELWKDNGEVLLIPTSAIRIIKILERARQNADAEILLRPYENAPQPENANLEIEKIRLGG